MTPISKYADLIVQELELLCAESDERGLPTAPIIKRIGCELISIRQDLAGIREKVSKYPVIS